MSQLTFVVAYFSLRKRFQGLEIVSYSTTNPSLAPCVKGEIHFVVPDGGKVDG